MVVIMDGKALAEKFKRDIAARVGVVKKERDIIPTLATILVGDDPSSRIYVKGKGRDCGEVGIGFRLRELPASTAEQELLELIDELNKDREVHGIIVQLPLPPHIDKKKIATSIKPQKDVDGLHPYNVGKLWLGMYNFENDLLPCTPKGIVKLLDHYGIELAGKLAVIINRSDLVGKPLSKLFLDRNATVLICHSKTQGLKKHALAADVLVSAVGRRPSFVVREDMVKEGAVVVDVGMNYVGGKLQGDVDFESVKEKASYITPVPGGVGPMTRVMLLYNALIAAKFAEGCSDE
ncbi:Bifunctional protein FolD protein [subsurface metagenome]|nr:bifunctional methylenetetrahydrofolate dehydrogenase/methenyltetrahydrofolate cyclohydrolase [Hadesarchaea archaeon]